MVEVPSLHFPWGLEKTAISYSQDWSHGGGNYESYYLVLCGAVESNVC
jgi:hypothetical protein